MIFGLDIASYQGQPDFRSLQRQHDFMISKATGEGNYFNAAYFPNVAAAVAAGMLPGSYDWVEPQRMASPEDGAAAARDYLRAIGPRAKGHLLCVDFETPDWRGGPLGTDIEAAMRAYIATLAQEGGQRILFYTGPYFMDETGAAGWDWLPQYCDLWIAAPGRDAMLPDDAAWPTVPCPPFARSVVHQHQWHAYSDAVVGEFDRDRCRLTAAELAARCGYPGDEAGEVAVATDPASPAEIISAAVTPQGGDVRIPPEGKWSVEIVDGQTIVALNFGGNTARIDGVRIADVGVSVESVTEPGVLEDRSFKDEQAQPWRERRAQ